MKKIIALALALIMALSMGVVAFAAPTTVASCDIITANVTPGTTIKVTMDSWLTAEKTLKGYKIDTDFTSAKYQFKGASMIEDIVITKDKAHVEVTLKDSFTSTDAKSVYGLVELEKKDAPTYAFYLNLTVKNNTWDLVGAKKAAEAETIEAKAETVQIMDEDGGYVEFVNGSLSGVVKMGKEEKVFFNFVDFTEDEEEAFLDALGEDFDGIYETYTFETRAFKEAVDFQYDAYEEDPHFFYVWDGETFTAIDAKYDADEEVDNYVFTAVAENTIVVTDVELVAAEEETKNPDTGANDVVGVAAALAVVSLVAAGAVSLKK